MADIKAFVDAMEINKVPRDVIEQIINIDYQKDGNPGQENANYYAKAIPKCEELLGFDMTAKIMFDRACSKSGYRLNNAIKLDKEHGGKTLPEKLELLGTLKNMGHPALNENGDIVSEAVGIKGYPDMTCPCWRLKGCKPVGEIMPLAYCLCCAGHFMFHYQKALNVKLRVKKVVSSIINSEGKEPCIFIYEIVK